VNLLTHSDTPTWLVLELVTGDKSLSASRTALQRNLQQLWRRRVQSMRNADHCIASTTYSAFSSTTDDHTDQLARFAFDVVYTSHMVHAITRLCKAVHPWDLVSGSTLQGSMLSGGQHVDRTDRVPSHCGGHAVADELHMVHEHSALQPLRQQ